MRIALFPHGLERSVLGPLLSWNWKDSTEFQGRAQKYESRNSIDDGLRLKTGIPGRPVPLAFMLTRPGKRATLRFRESFEMARDWPHNGEVGLVASGRVLKQDSMSPPDSSKQRSPWNRQPLTGGSSAFSLESYDDVAQVAKTLSELGGGAVALDLALDLVLNEVVEQARLATGATAAAIALERDGEMVCRATTGQHAPELGMRMETDSGLSGECLRTGEVQNCSDTDTDSRVDAEACRQLGIRSVLLVPLKDGDRSFGIVEAFASRPNAFGDRDVNTLQALASRVIGSKRAAEQGSAGGIAPMAGDPAAADSISVPEQPPTEGPDSPTETEMAGNTDSIPILNTIHNEPQNEPHLDRLEESRGSEIWTTVLVILVIAAAISLGVVIGWRGALQGSVAQPTMRDGGNPSSSLPSRPEPNPAAATSPTDRAGSRADPATAGDSSATGATALSQRKQATGGSAAQSGGGLTVTENGKVIYRLPSQPIPGSAASTNSGAETAGTRLIRRVNPDYPEEARRNKIQGPVVLEVQVLGNGNVGAIEIAAGNPVLAEAAVHAVKQWKYQAYVVDGRPVQSQMRITIRFTLPSS